MYALNSCPKGYTTDLDKVVSPDETVRRVKEILEKKAAGVLSETRRIDTGRLGIPVYMSMCGPRARQVMPTRKQMGKGSSKAQAEASALMELVERYSYFSFWADEANFERLTWSEAEERWPGQVISVEEIIRSVGDTLTPEQARKVMDLTAWRFREVFDVGRGKAVRVPLDWFKKLNEFNGSSAGNTFEESLLQGACELVERHVSAVADRERTALPTIDQDSLGDEVLKEILACFTSHGIKVWLKDFTLGMPVPTVAAVAYDPSTFPGLSEIVFTAGTASSPAKAAIRALTEVAQLGGDFETGSNYEASGLSKFGSVEEIRWLEDGPVVPLSSLPSIERSDIRDEIMALCQGLAAKGLTLCTVDTTRPDLGIPANYSFVPGFLFRERTVTASLGLFVGRVLAEEADLPQAEMGLGLLAEFYPDAPFVPFFEGLLALRAGDMEKSLERFATAEPMQADSEDAALCAFYRAHAMTSAGDYESALPHLDRAIDLCPEIKEYYNLRGVALFKRKDFESAACDFQKALELDSGSAMDLANLGLCHEFMGRQETAAEYLEAALKLDPGIEFAAEHLRRLRGNPK